MKKQIFLFLLTASISLSAAAIEDIHTFTANFRQTIHNDQQAKIIYRGKLFAQKEHNQALWIYTDPINKRIYYSGGKVVIIEPELEQAIFAKLDKVPNILTLLKKAKKKAPHTYVTTFNNTQYTILFKEGKLDRIRYKDAMHNQIEIAFDHQKTNLPIDGKKFLYQIPADYDILEQK